MMKQRQLQMAMNIGLARERLKYYSGFYATVTILGITGAYFKKNPQFLIPIVPLSFMLAFQYDMCYGNMMERATQTADTLLVENPMKFCLPEHSGLMDLE